jgi:hypothetical protein
MKRCDYTNVKSFLHDEDLKKLLCVDRTFEGLLEHVTRDDFLEIDGSMKIPFFAETRDYVGAVEKGDPGGVWIVKPVSGSEVLKTEMATVCFLLDFYTRTISAPLVITRIGGALYKATKLILRAEQLSGAKYTELSQLKEQLLLDVINRWIYFDEDRNPNNYMIRYNSRNDQIVIAIDFLNADLVSDEMKIVGTEKRFGWERKEKTRYLTPLQCQNCLEYDMGFFGMRLKYFKKLTFPFLKRVCQDIFRIDPEREKHSRTIADNLLKRVEYVDGYFRANIKAASRGAAAKKYREMGKSFARFYGE